MSKSSVVGIAREHLKILRDASTAKIRIVDLLFQFVLPIALGVACFLGGWRLPDATNAIMGVSIVAALMCAIAVLVFQIRMQASSDEKLSGSDLRFINERFVNIMWTILVGLLLALILIAFDATNLFSSETAGCIVTALAVALCMHFIIVIGMCLKRLQRAYQRVDAKMK